MCGHRGSRDPPELIFGEAVSQSGDPCTDSRQKPLHTELGVSICQMTEADRQELKDLSPSEDATGPRHRAPCLLACEDPSNALLQTPWLPP